MYPAFVGHKQIVLTQYQLFQLPSSTTILIRGRKERGREKCYLYMCPSPWTARIYQRQIRIGTMLTHFRIGHSGRGVIEVRRVRKFVRANVRIGEDDEISKEVYIRSHPSVLAF
jgi:hypothetical protein